MATIHKPFKYVPALHTDIRQTIRRELMRLKAIEDTRREGRANVTPLAKTKARGRP